MKDYQAMWEKLKNTVDSCCVEGIDDIYSALKIRMENIERGHGTAIIFKKDYPELAKTLEKP